MEKPEFVTDEHLDYLDKLHRNGTVNMLSAKEFLPANFPELSYPDAREVLTYWLTINKEQATNE